MLKIKRNIIIVCINFVHLIINYNGLEIWVEMSEFNIRC